MSRNVRAMICLVVMLLAPLAPALGPASAQTNPPTGSGDWMIPGNDVTVISANASNNGQILIQGDLNVASRISNSDTGLIMIAVFIALALGAAGGWYTRKMQFVEEFLEAEESLWVEDETKQEKRKVRRKSKDDN